MKITIFERITMPFELFEQKYDDMTSSFTPPPRHKERDVNDVAYLHKLYRLASFVICSEENESIIGFTAYYKNHEACQIYISLIAVKKEYWSNGIGSKMLQELETYKLRGYTSIGLEVSKANNRAYNFYKKHGFIEIEDRGLKILMRKSL